MRHYWFDDSRFETKEAHSGGAPINTFRAETKSNNINFIDITMLPAHTRIGRHTHADDNEEIYVVIDGDGQMELNDKTIDVSPGHVIVNPPGGTHSLRNTGERALKLVVIEVASRPSAPQDETDPTASSAGAAPEEPVWLPWARQLQAHAQIGLAYANNPYDVSRYEAIRNIAATMMARGSAEPYDRIETLFRQQAGYATPKVDVRGAVFSDDAVLLVREVSDGLWTLPGGWADIDQSPAEAVLSEIKEEAGLIARVNKLAAVLDRSKHPHHPPFAFHVYKFFFVCEVIGGEMQPSLETSDVRYFPVDDLPPLSTDRVLADQIKMAFRHYRHPELPTEFD